jgi:4-hydroxy-4-methyl-2-oxoglutarate aldolase
MAHRIPNFERMSGEAKARLSLFNTSALCDGMELPSAMHYSLKPLSQGWKIIGPALTVSLPVGDSLLTSLAIEIAQEGDVIVVDAKGVPENAVWGDMKSFAARAKGIGGIVIDGAVRDPDGIREVGVPVFAKYVTCRASSKNNGGEICTPISCAGAVVNPGDIIVGDEGGVVVIPQSKLDEVLAKAEAKLASEEKTRRDILEGQYISKGVRAELERLGWL